MSDSTPSPSPSAVTSAAPEPLPPQHLQPAPSHGSTADGDARRNDKASSPMSPHSTTQTANEKETLLRAYESETKQQQPVGYIDGSNTKTDASNLPPRSTNADALSPPSQAVLPTRPLPLTPADFSENVAWDVIVDVYPRAYMQMQMLSDEIAGLPQSKAVEKARLRRDKEVEEARLRLAQAEEEGGRDVAEQEGKLEAVPHYQLLRKTERLHAHCKGVLAGASTARPSAGTSGTAQSLSVAPHGTSPTSSSHSAAPRATDLPPVHPDGHAAVITPLRPLPPPTETERAQMVISPSQPHTPIKPQESQTENNEDSDLAQQEEDTKKRPGANTDDDSGSHIFCNAREALSLAERHRLHHVVDYIRKSKKNLRVCVYHKKDGRTGLCKKEPQNCLPWDSGKATLSDLREVDQAMSKRQGQSESKAQSDARGAAEKRHHDSTSESDDDDDVGRAQRPTSSKQQKTASSSTPVTARSGRPSSGSK